MKYIFILLLLSPALTYGQLADSILDKVRSSTREYSIDYDTVPITGSRTLPCLSVMINGNGPFDFLIDLGSNVVIFKESVVAEAGMKTVVDRTRGDIVMANKVAIGESVFYNVHGAAYEDLDVDGVIGFNLLRHANFLLDYPNLRFAFLAEGPERSDTTYLEYEVVGRMPYLESSVGTKKVLINFDTGASLWLYFPLSMKDSLQFVTPIQEFRKMTNNQTGTTMTYIGQISEDVVFGNYILKSPYVVFDPDIEDVYVGSSLLSQFKLSFYPGANLLKMERADKGNLIVIPENQTKIKD